MTQNTADQKNPDKTLNTLLEYFVFLARQSKIPQYERQQNIDSNNRDDSHRCRG